MVRLNVMVIANIVIGGLNHRKGAIKNDRENEERITAYQDFR